MISKWLSIFPAYRALQRWRSDARARRYWCKMSGIIAKLHKCLDGKVMQGPFAGLVYPLELAQPDRCPMLLGAYEEEIHPVLERVKTQRFAQIADVGCAEGYYAAGLALLFPCAQVYAFDVDENARDKCRKMCASNGLDKRVQIMGECTPSWLQNNLHSESLIFCDCEGGELGLLQPTEAPILKTTTIIIELHDNLCPGLSAQLLPRFSESHHLELISQASTRDTSRFANCGLSKDELNAAVREYRSGVQQWAVLEPLDHENDKAAR